MKQTPIYGMYYHEKAPELRLRKRQQPGWRTSIERAPQDLIETADVERVFLRDAFAAVLALPLKTCQGWLEADPDSDSLFDIGPFGTVDFNESLDQPDELVDALSHELYMTDLISSRIEAPEKYRTIEFLLAGIYNTGDLFDWNMYCLALHCLRVRRLVFEIDEREAQNMAWQWEEIQRIRLSLE